MTQERFGVFLVCNCLPDVRKPFAASILLKKQHARAKSSVRLKWVLLCNGYIDCQPFLVVFERIGIANRKFGTIWIKPINLPNHLVLLLLKVSSFVLVIAAECDHGVIAISQQLVGGFTIREPCSQGLLHLGNASLHAILRTAHAINAIILNEILGIKVMFVSQGDSLRLLGKSAQS